MIRADETFNGSWPFAPHFFAGNDFKMHYVDEGHGTPLICLHGEPTWGYLYRNFIPPLSRDHRVIVPDHMGFGKSETPQDRKYTLQTHTENLAALIDDLDLHDITLVIQDWGGANRSCVCLAQSGARVTLCINKYSYRLWGCPFTRSLSLVPIY